MKKKIGMFFIRGICLLIILGGIGNVIIVCNSETISVTGGAHTYSKTEEIEDGEGMLYSLGMIVVGSISLLMTKDSYNNKSDKDEQV